MTDHILNPRRVPRAPARCRTAIVSAAGTFDSETEDIGSRGCQVVSPKPFPKGEPVECEISNDEVAGTLRIGGRIAWASARAPWRLGIAFDEVDFDESARWMELLFEAYPALGALRRVPDRIPLHATVYLGTPPRLVVDFTADEAKLLRTIASGAQLDELMARLRGSWPTMQRALFSLLAHQHITLSRGASVHPSTWKRILDEVEGTLAVESMPGAPQPSAARAASAAPPAPTAARLAPTARVAPPARPPPPEPFPTLGTFPPPAIDEPLELVPMTELVPPSPTFGSPTPPPLSPGPWIAEPLGYGRAREDAFGSAHGPQPDFAGAGVGWRAPSGPRPAEAQGCYERAMLELEAGRPSGALALLRRALALAPGDAEVAAAIAVAMFRGRTGE